jgi:hypothetical protein
VTCQEGEGTCKGVFVDGGTNDVKCIPTLDGKPTCDEVSCAGGVCKRSCGDGGVGCGPVTSCSGTCTAWEDAGDGGVQ